ncbi:hypothetical protein ACN9MH_04765 [Paenibacillus silvae]|uniref:hypothetical protein n=1 Tax=Paenibacillus TaxID=44249 RepID=UPI001C0F9285|nr:MULTISPECIES: hypothetical protein [Paenibacillus]MBU5353299.1 hypothetical protein [Paenibacillus barcinonensis]MDM5279741.1 hypothetical protein [Paenibacillus silvae]
MLHSHVTLNNKDRSVSQAYRAVYIHPTFDVQTLDMRSQMITPERRWQTNARL